MTLYEKASRAWKAWHGEYVLGEDRTSFIAGYEQGYPSGFAAGQQEANIKNKQKNARVNKSWAICVGGLIQDSSPDLEYIDLDWLENTPMIDIEEAEQSYELLSRLKLPNWAAELAEVTERLEAAYDAEEYPQRERVTN